MKYRRRAFRLIRPGLQLRLILVFLALSATSLLLQYMLFEASLASIALDLPHDGAIVLEESNGMLGRILLVSFAVFVPVTFVFGVLTTHRFAGPIYRMQKYLEQVIRGERPNDCRLRGGDELQEFCRLINDATAPIRRSEVACVDATRDGAVRPKEAANERPAPLAAIPAVNESAERSSSA